MQNKQNSSLLEPINHVTGSLPISFHHTIKPQGPDLVLYLHWHSELEFLYIVKGKAIFCIEGNEYPLMAGDGIFVPPNLLHMAKSIDDSECEFYAFVFSPSLLSDSYTNPHYTKYVLPIMHQSLRYCLHLTPDISWQNRILNDLRDMYHLSLGDIDQWELQIHGMLLIIWQLLYNYYFSTIEATKNFSKLTSQLEDAIEFIHHSYNDEISLNQLAHITNMSEGQFCRLFKQLTGYTPFCYLNRYRILESCKYLNSTTKKVAEIATLCGFNNISYFNREFVKIMSMSPSAYRKSIQS